MATVLCVAGMATAGARCVPARAQFGPPGPLYVVDNGRDSVSEVYPGSASPTTPDIPVDHGPQFIALSPDGGTGYVTNTTAGTVSVINTVTHSDEGAVKVESLPVGVAVSRDGRDVYVANSGSNTVSVIETWPYPRVIDTIGGFAAPMGVAVSMDDRYVYVTNYGSNTVSVIDRYSNYVSHHIDVGDRPMGVAVSPYGGYAYVVNSGSHDVSVIDTSYPYNPARYIDLPGGAIRPSWVAFSPDSAFAYVTNNGSDSVSVIDTGGGYYGYGWAWNPLPVGHRPVGVAVDCDGMVYVANSDSAIVNARAPGTVSVLERYGYLVRTINGFTTPYGLATRECLPTVGGGHVEITAYPHDYESDISTENGYRIEIHNPGPYGDAFVHEISVRLPPGFIYRDNSTTGMFYSDPERYFEPDGSTVLIWRNPSHLPPGAWMSFDFRVETPEVPGHYCIDVDAISDGKVMVQNYACITVTGSADLKLTKSVVPDDIATTGVRPGETFTYELHAHNGGPSFVNQATITDKLPEGFRFLGSPENCYAAGAPVPGQVVTCHIGPISYRQTVTVPIHVEVTPDAPRGIHYNAAVITSDLFNPNEEQDEPATVPVEVRPDVRLTLTKEALPPDVVAGGEATFRITVGNDGQSPADAELSDFLPDGMSFLRFEETPPNSSCQPGPWLHCVLTVEPGTPAALTIVAHVANDVPNGQTLRNRAVVTAPDNTTGQNGEVTTEADVRVTASAGLEVRKELDPPGLVAGQTGFYRIRAVNRGPSTATDVSVVDHLVQFPPGVTFDQGKSPECTGPPDGPVTCHIGTLKPGAEHERTITIAVDVPSSVPVGAMVSNRAQAESPEGNSNVADLTEPVQPGVGEQSSIEVSKQLTPPAQSVVAGGTAHWTVQVHNTGPSEATGVVVDDVPGSGGFTITGLSGPGAQCDVQNLTCTIEHLPSNQSAAIEVSATVDPDASGHIVNCVASPSSFNCSSPVPVTQEAHLTLSKVSDPEAVAAGNTVRYLLEVANEGPSTASPVTLTDTLPAGLTFTGSNGNCSLAGGTPATGQTVECAVNSIDPGRENIHLLEIEARTDPGLHGVVTDHASARAPQSGTEPADFADTRIEGPASLAIDKTAQPTGAGDTLTWHVKVTNHGPGEADGAIVTDTMPTGLTIIRVTSDNGTCTHQGQRVRCTLGALAGGQAATLTEVTRTAPDLVTPGKVFTIVKNAASLDYAGDTTTDDNDVTFEATVFAQAHLVPFKTVSPEPLTTGGLATYRVTATNHGPSVATDITVNDRLPGPLRFDAAASDHRCSLSVRGVVRCVAPGPLGVRGRITFTVVARVDRAIGSGSVLVNDAVASAAQYDPTPAGAARATSTVTGQTVVPPTVPAVPVTG